MNDNIIIHSTAKCKWYKKKEEEKSLWIDSFVWN